MVLHKLECGVGHCLSSHEDHQDLDKKQRNFTAGSHKNFLVEKEILTHYDANNSYNNIRKC